MLIFGVLFLYLGFLAAVSLHMAGVRARAMYLQDSYRQPVKPMHVLFGAEGNHSGFMSELETAVKSVLLNAPLDTSLDLHFMVDTVAQNAIEERFLHQLNIASWSTRQPLRLHTYNVEPFLPRWIDQIKQTYRHYPPEMERFRHTAGAYFRLFANELLPSHVQHVLYMDSDVVIMAGLDRLWSQVTSQVDKGYYFQWGQEKCSGFNVIDIQKLPDFWKRIQKYDLLTLRPGSDFADPKGNFTKTLRNAQKILHQRGLGDQILIRSMQVTEPHLIGSLPASWDVSAENGAWTKRNGTGLDQDRPDGVGMLHFNGGGSSQDSYARAHPYVNPDEHDQNLKFDSTWGLVRYYNNLPWNWAKFIVESRSSDVESSSTADPHQQQRLFLRGS